jgi:hypothetical protein
MSHCKGALLLLGLAGPVLAVSAGPSASAGDAASSAKSTRTAQGAVTLARWTIDAGGTTNASGGSFRLAATIGQPEAALVGAASYVLSAGLWAPRPRAPSGDLIFADGFESP